MPNPVKKTYNYYKKIAITTPNFADNKFVWDFVSAGILLLNEGTAGNVVEYSFDGVETHGELDPSRASAGLSFDSRHHSKIYLRLASGTSAVIRIETWA